MFTRAKLSPGSRRVRGAVSSLLAVSVAASGFTTASCVAAPRLPGGTPASAAPLRAASGEYEFEVLSYGVPVPTYQHAGGTYVLGELGARYTLRVINHTGRRIEAVVSIDGRDAMDGKPASYRTNRGYVVGAWDAIEVDGWRLSTDQVAAFRFSSVADSYAARTGSAREVGVIGVAVFPERYVAAPRPVYTPPHSRYSPPRYPTGRHYQMDDLLEGGGGSPRKRSSSSPSSVQDPGKAEGAADAQADAARAPAAPKSSGDGLERSAEAPLSRQALAPARRPGLGTEFGERVDSSIREVTFVRANSAHPATILGARYNDRDGLMARGIDVDRCCGAIDEDLAWRESASPFPLPVSTRRYATPPRGWQRGCCVR